MKSFRLLLTTFAATMAMNALADNDVQTVEQVTETITLADDVDLHISSETPFADDGIVNITNTDHAVLIFDALRPSAALRQLSKVQINGRKATNNTNCQVKIYNNGAIVLPYGTSTKPLTLFSEPNFEGDSNNSLTEGHNGSGYMKDLPATWNNRIRSFRLKRGYMVTFALQKSGRGYSRCFIADKADLEVAAMPAIMDSRISSYRIFTWYDTGKKHLASAAGNKDALTKLNVQSSYDWGQGNTSLQPDFEWVPNHIYEDWPSSSAIGQATQSPHTKNNNEPRNSSDDHPQDLATILGNWENMMRTGLRLCSPASWDGSDYWNATGFLADFLDSIDARGWRCDIIDLHCYWPEGNFGNVNNWANKFKRPIWISEWCWGASWNNNGSFSSSATEASFATAIKNITTRLNENNNVERYYYWDGENGNFPCRMIRNGALTQAGKYYSEMKTGLAYTGSLNYVPTNWRLSTPELKGTYTAAKGTMKLQWNNVNGDLATTITLERRLASGGTWEALQTYDGIANETRTSFTVNDTLRTTDTFNYRVHEVTYAGKHIYSNTVTQVRSGSQGPAATQNGSVTIKPTETTYCYFGTPFATQPVVITGSPTNKNSGAGMVDNVLAISTVDGDYSYFQFRLNRWKTDASAAANNNETVNYLVFEPGRGQLGQLNYEAAYTEQSVGRDAIDVTFSQPFQSVPVVFATPVFPTAAAPACMWRISDVTTTGFRLQLLQEKGVTTNLMPRPVAFLAIEPGTGSDGAGTLYTVLTRELTFKTANQTADFGAELTEPRVLAQLQTNSNGAAAVMRLGTVKATDVSLRLMGDKSDTANLPSASNPVTETIGLIVLSTDPDYDAVIMPRAAADASQPTYTLSGIRVATPSQPGIYIRGGRKILIKK